ncbi:pyrimidine 5 -nucleotidase [Tubulinosema ratisbonensis]|uniref:Pyrimidine 5-nucleotidase n=1 Tax=Tubulinosema ratisbonensis TaxID=291195 RepID=A0A437AJJ1_9MICR|nr:pyrimidine 5 -nucleotidase [Tubulinosema ratisbonensis]
MLLFFINFCKSLKTILLKQDEVSLITKTNESVKNLYLFDFDGTLYTPTDELKIKAKNAQEESLKKNLQGTYNKDTTFKEFVKNYKFPFQGLIRLGYNSRTVLDETVNEAFKDFKLEISDELADKIKNLPGDKMILTNNLAEKVKDIIDDSKLKDIFTFVIGPNFYSRIFISKPSSEVFIMLNDKFKNDLKYENVYLFDDEPDNVEGGKSVNWISVECKFNDLSDKISELIKK